MSTIPIPPGPFIEIVPKTNTICDTCPSIECICRMCNNKRHNKRCIQDPNYPFVFPKNKEEWIDCRDTYMERFELIEH